jgi:LAO/AO transport system kinase
LKKKLSVETYCEGILAGNRVVLAQAITLVESTLQEDERLAAMVVDTILPYAGNSLRLGITGVPGVGKSTFIETFGTYLTKQNKTVAVLTVDPTSQLTHGSILGDKTRMELLSKNPAAFIRPTASSSVLGGVAQRTRECILLCEAAGFDVVIVETVGAGQSETVVKNMTDFFLLLLLAGAGDELQGIKKGIMEMADAIVVTKADGDNKMIAAKAQADCQHALHLFQPSKNGWLPKVMVCSAFENTGIAETWKAITSFEFQQKETGYFATNRKEQNVNWMHENIELLIKNNLYNLPTVKNTLLSLEKRVRENELTARQASVTLYSLFLKTLSVKG